MSTNRPKTLLARLKARACTILVCAAASAAPSLSFAGITIGSWNIERLGHGDQKSYASLAKIAQHFDLIAVQEAMTESGLRRLVQALEDVTGDPWDVIYSHRIGRGSYREKYAYTWRESTVEYVDGAAVYLDVSDQYAREPFSARFRSKISGQDFVMANIHVLYGRSKSDRTPEIQALANYWAWLEEVYPGVPKVLAGDFNLRPGHHAWKPLKQYAQPLVTQGATTVSSINGRFANLYDNLWVAHTGPQLAIAEAGIVNGPAMLGWSHEQFRRHASDHVPVFARLKSTHPRTNETAPSVAYLPGGPPPAPEATNGLLRVRGNVRSQVYHLPGCPSFDAISERNRVKFESEEHAVTEGFRKAGNCP